MRKFYFIIMMSVYAVIANAQMAPGSIVPDFTGTDLNGTDHNLYSYLDLGYTVVIDVSATWCSPCWSYHTSNALEDVYSKYGPGGSVDPDKIMVLFIEGDNSTNLADLQGTGSNTQGDWITGTPYPIIDDANIANLLEIGYFPTVYMVCPDRVIHEIGTMTEAQIYAESGNCPALSTTTNDTKLFSILDPNNTVYCDSANIAPKIKIQNYGTANLTSATITPYLDNVAYTPINWTGDLAMYESIDITFPNLHNLDNSQHNFKAIVSLPNGNADDDNTNDEDNVNFTVNTDGAEATVLFHTDAYPNESSWHIEQNGVILVTSERFSSYDHTYTGIACLTPGECYDFVINDAYGDGFNEYVSGYAILEFNGSELVNVQGSTAGSFSEKIVNFCMPSLVSVDNFKIEKEIILFPNPSTGIVNIKGAENSTIEVLNSLGQVVLTVNNASNMESVNLSAYNEGTYIVRVITNNNITVKKVNIVK